jgi:hypothetical protein
MTLKILISIYKYSLISLFNKVYFKKDGSKRSLVLSVVIGIFIVLLGLIYFNFTSSVPIGQDQDIFRSRFLFYIAFIFSTLLGYFQAEKVGYIGDKSQTYIYKRINILILKRITDTLIFIFISTFFFLGYFLGPLFGLAPLTWLSTLTLYCGFLVGKIAFSSLKVFDLLKLFSCIAIVYLLFIFSNVWMSLLSFFILVFLVVFEAPSYIVKWFSFLNFSPNINKFNVGKYSYWKQILRNKYILLQLIPMSIIVLFLNFTNFVPWPEDSARMFITLALSLMIPFSVLPYVVENYNNVEQFFFQSQDRKKISLNYITTTVCICILIILLGFLLVYSSVQGKISQVLPFTFDYLNIMLIVSILAYIIKFDRKSMASNNAYSFLCFLLMGAYFLIFSFLVFLAGHFLTSLFLTIVILLAFIIYCRYSKNVWKK